MWFAYMSTQNGFLFSWMIQHEFKNHFSNFFCIKESLFIRTMTKVTIAPNNSFPILTLPFKALEITFSVQLGFPFHFFLAIHHTTNATTSATQLQNICTSYYLGLHGWNVPPTHPHPPPFLKKERSVKSVHSAR